MTKRNFGPLEASAFVAFGIALALVVTGGLDPVALIILLVLGYFTYLARGVIEEAQRVRPVEPPVTWAVTMIGNLVLMAIGIGSFGWYLAGGGSMAWVPFLIFMAGFMALRWWRRDVVQKLYAWRTPALTLLQQGEYKRLVRELEPTATAGRGHPDKLAMVALAYTEMNKWDRADKMLTQARALAPDYASVNGALGALRRHQARYDDAVSAIQEALTFEENVNSRYYMGLCQFLAGDLSSARATLEAIIDAPDLIRQGQVYGAYILAQAAQQAGDDDAVQSWHTRMAESAPKVIPALEDEYRRHKQSAYGETLKEHVRAMQKIIAQRPQYPS